MNDIRHSLLQAAANARIHLQPDEEQKFVAEIGEILRIFDKIDAFRGPTAPLPVPERHSMREDRVHPSSIDPLGNALFIRNRKFLGPRLVD